MTFFQTIDGILIASALGLALFFFILYEVIKALIKPHKDLLVKQNRLLRLLLEQQGVPPGKIDHELSRKD